MSLTQTARLLRRMSDQAGSEEEEYSIVSSPAGGWGSPRPSKAGAARHAPSPNTNGSDASPAQTHRRSAIKIVDRRPGRRQQASRLRAKVTPPPPPAPAAEPEVPKVKAAAKAKKGKRKRKASHTAEEAQPPQPPQLEPEPQEGVKKRERSGKPPTPTPAPVTAPATAPAPAAAAGGKNSRKRKRPPAPAPAPAPVGSGSAVASAPTDSAAAKKKARLAPKEPPARIIKPILRTPVRGGKKGVKKLQTDSLLDQRVHWSPQLVSGKGLTYSPAEYDRTWDFNKTNCDVCGCFIIEVRHHCTRCPDYDLCGSCYKFEFKRKPGCRHGRKQFIAVSEEEEGMLA